jgi:hypothetical protein
LIVLKRDRTDIQQTIERAFQSVGIDTGDTIARSMIDIIVSAIETEYLDIYALEANTRIDTANDSYLDHYGQLLDEPRQTQTFAIVDDLKTIRLSMEDANGNIKKGKEFTISGDGFDIESGTPLLNNENQIVMYTTQTVRLTEESIYVKAISADINTSIIPEGTITGVQYDLLSSPDIDQNLIGNYKLVAINESDIEKEIVAADTETYRFVLQSKARSVNLSNDEKLNTIFDNTRVRRYKVAKLNPASTSLVVYVETTNVEIESLILEHVQRQLENILPYGMDVRVRPYIYSTVSANFNILVDATNPALIGSSFINAFIDSVNINLGGSLIDFQAIVESIKPTLKELKEVEIDYISINSRELLKPKYQPKEIEKVFAYSNSVTYVA